MDGQGQHVFDRAYRDGDPRQSPSHLVADYHHHTGLTDVASAPGFLSFDGSASQWAPLVSGYRPADGFALAGNEAPARPPWGETFHGQQRDELGGPSHPHLVLPDSTESDSAASVPRRTLPWNSTSRLGQEHLQIRLENLRLFASASSSPSPGSKAPPSPSSTSVSSQVGLSDAFITSSLDPADAQALRRLGTPSHGDGTPYDDPFDLSHPLTTLPNLGPQSILTTQHSLHYLPSSSSSNYLFELPDHESPSLMLPGQRVWDSPAASASEELLAVVHMDSKAYHHPSTTRRDHHVDQRDRRPSYPSRSSYPLPPSNGYAAPAIMASPDPSFENQAPATVVLEHKARTSSLPPALPARTAHQRSSRSGPPQVLKCTYANCSSKVLFTRPCDLAKHYRQHFRRFQCRIEGCRATAGFATKKDRLRHERTHNPSILCETCGRKFSRLDNLRDHVRRRHQL